MRQLTVNIWRQLSSRDEGHFETYQVEAPEHLSLLDLIDLVNEQISARDGEPINYDSDCREGICGACGVSVNGVPHGPKPNTPTCRQHVRDLESDEVTIAPFSAGAFPVIRDLVIDRSALTKLSATAHVSLNAGKAPDADAIPITHDEAERALDFAACIGCGACVAVCPNSAANLFIGAKLAHLAELPGPALERKERARSIIAEADQHFGYCSTHGECTVVCPAGIDLSAISKAQQEILRLIW